MPSRSAFADFMSTTLAAVPDRWNKLLYVSGLRDSEGRYCHWGLAKMHGEKAVQQALASAHRAVFLEVLRTPLPELFRDACQSALNRQQETQAYMEELCRRGADLLPADLGGGSQAHFNSVLRALSSLARRFPANLPAA